MLTTTSSLRRCFYIFPLSHSAQIVAQVHPRLFELKQPRACASTARFITSFVPGATLAAGMLKSLTKMFRMERTQIGGASVRLTGPVGGSPRWLNLVHLSRSGGEQGGAPAVASTAPPRVLESMGTWSGVVACSSWPRSAGSGSKVPLGVGCYDGPTYSPSWGPCTSRRQPRCPPNSSPTSASTTCTSTRGWGTSWSADNGIWRQPTEVDKFYSADVNAPPPPAAPVKS